jgi:hypothetical protein
MTRRAHGHLSVEVPDDWEDKSIVAFAAPRRPGKVVQPNIVVTRDRLPSGQNLQTYASRQLTVARKQLPHFTLKETRLANVGRQPAVVHRFTWDSDSGPLVQTQLIVAFDESIYSVTTSTPRGEDAKTAEAFDRILSTLDFTSATPKEPLAGPLGSPGQ